jgi:hypothetical protein
MREKGVHYQDEIIWNQERTYKHLYTNHDINLLYKTCFDSKDRKYDFWEPLRDTFIDKFKVELIGLANAESRTIAETDVCLHIIGNPITEKKMSEDLSGNFEIHDPNHDVH